MELLLVVVAPMKINDRAGTREQRARVRELVPKLLAEFDPERLYRREPPLPDVLEDCGYELDSLQDDLAGSSYWASTDQAVIFRKNLLIRMNAVAESAEELALHSTAVRVREMASIFTAIGSR